MSITNAVERDVSTYWEQSSVAQYLLHVVDLTRLPQNDGTDGFTYSLFHLFRFALSTHL